mmetsp:Transcript_22709/g.37423  ORF Transcript_22709/g.37423 Transcript_22709/m.37423 type:complete len:277 (+) Transcript_22709:69-899(+)
MVQTRRSTNPDADAGVSSVAAPPVSAAAAPPAAKASRVNVKRIKSSASAAIKPKNYYRPNLKKDEQPNQKYDKRPNSVAQREEEKKQGSLFGWSVLAPGRPKKATETEKVPEANATESNPEPEENAPRVTQKPPPRGKYQKYEGDTEKATDSPYEAAVTAAQEVIPNYEPKRTTLLSRVSKEKERREQAASNDEHRFDRKQPAGRGLTSNDEVELLQSLVADCDNKNNGLSRKGAIQVLSKITGASLKKATEHFKYLVRAGKLSKLRYDVRVASER